MKLLPIDSVLKIAELKTELKPHQSKILNKLQNQRGLVAVRGMGQGKSLIGLSAIEKSGLPATAIAPASLRENLPKEQAKHFTEPFQLQHDTIQNIARKGTIKKNPFLLIDEAHNLRNSSSKATSVLKKLSPEAEKILLMTGTPFYNSVSDLSPLVNIAAGENVLPEGQDFKNKYVTEQQINPSFFQRFKGIQPGTKEILNPAKAQELKAILNKWVDYEAPSKEGFPDVKEQKIEVPMTDKQLAIYDTVAGKLPPWVAEKVKSGLLPNRQEAANLNAYLSGLRQTGLGTHGYVQDKPESPKIQRAFEEFKKILATNPQAKATIYSNFINSGINPYKELLEKEGIPFGEFSGNVSDKNRQQAVKDYNEGKLRALLLGPSAGEGLDLQNTNLTQILDAAWNDSKINQAQARSIRFGSHSSLPPEQRKVLVQKFLATRPQTLGNRLGLTKRQGAIDEYLYNLSKTKSDLSKQFEALMEEQDLPKIAHNEEALAKAEKIKEELKKRFNVTPFLSGSLYLGTNVPGKHDFDFNLHVQSKQKFDNLQNKFEKLFTPSTYNSPKKDHYIFHTQVYGEDVDLALTYGQKGRAYQDSLRAAKKEMTPEKKEEIIKQKQKLHNAWFFKERRTKDFKRRLDQELGIKRIQRGTLKEAEHYNRKDIYGHRTNNLESIIEHGLLSAHDAHKKGLLKSFEAGNNTLDAIFKGREKETESPTKLKTSIYLTPGLMPSSSAYGPYGVLTRKRQVEQSKYLNTIPGEVTTSKVKGKLTFVVPDEELSTWQNKYKNHTFLAESKIPENKKLPEKDYSEILKRLIAMPKFRHDTKEINEKIAKISDDVDKFLNTKNYQFLIKKLPSPKFQSSLISKIEDPSLKNFIANNGKHAIALKKNKGTHHQIESSSHPAKSYTVIDHGTSWTCNCQDYLYKKAPKNGECKHIIKAKELEKTASAYVTHFSQEKQTTCSAACAKMVLDYYGIYKTEEECEKGIGVHSKGAENDQVADFLTKSGLKCINKELSPEEVKQFLDMNCPIIIDGKSFKYPGKFHYTVLSDLDTEKDVVVVFDPNYDKKIRTLTLKELDDIWHSKQMYKPHKPLIRQGIVVIGHEKTAEESTFQKYKPYIAGAGGLLAGAATYKGLRRFNPSMNKGLSTLQNAMKDKKLAIQVNNASKLHTPIFGAKTVDRTTKNLGKDYGVLNHSTSTQAIPSGGPAINTDLANAMDNKVTFDKIMNQGVGYGPSQVANPTAKNTDYLHGALKDVGGDINRLKKKYPEFIMKPATGSLGQVENLVTSADHPVFQKALRDEGMARNMLIQEKLPIDKEFRVHTLNGVPFSTMNRRIENPTLRKAWEKLTGSSGGGAFIPAIGKERQALNQFVSDAHKHIQPAFEQGHNLHSAYDVAKLKDGTYRMIESNPTPGTLMNPIINRKLQRMATGRWGKDVAALGALGTGAATTGAIANLE